MKFRASKPWILAAALSITAPLGAQDLSGAWEMSSTAIVPVDESEMSGEKGIPVGSECVFSGLCDMSQDGTSLSGTVQLSLVSGGASCPAEMNATLEGTVDEGGDNVVGGLSGMLGNATFEGSRGNSFLGDFVATDGPFAGTTGSWLAVRPESLVLEIPTAGAIGLGLLTLTLMAAGLWIFRSRRLVA